MLSKHRETITAVALAIFLIAGVTALEFILR